MHYLQLQLCDYVYVFRNHSIQMRSNGFNWNDAFEINHLILRYFTDCHMATLTIIMIDNISTVAILTVIVNGIIIIYKMGILPNNKILSTS